MIKSINSSSIWLDISGNRPYLTPPSSRFKYPESPYVGQIVYDFSMQEIYVYNGDVWSRMEGHSNIGVSSAMESLMLWASKKMHEEENLEVLCNKYPALAEAREQFEAMKTLVGKHDI